MSTHFHMVHLLIRAGVDDVIKGPTTVVLQGQELMVKLKSR
jgi:hypothetical protein